MSQVKFMRSMIVMVLSVSSRTRETILQNNPNEGNVCAFRIGGKDGSPLVMVHTI
jgi:CRISPR/Cas system-associated protein endoribonuclease Cas2